MVRLDFLVRKYIEEKFGEILSRSYIQRVLDAGAVKINGQVIKRKGIKFPDLSYLQKLQFNDELIAKIVNEYLTGQDAAIESKLWSQSAGLNSIKISKEKLEKVFDLKDYIVYEDDNFLLTYKPPGVLSHPDDKGNPNNMVYAFIKYMKSINKDVPRAGLLHRLDKDTQGLLLFAKNMKAYNHVKRQFMEHQIHKIYLVVHAIPKNVSGLGKAVVRELSEKKLLEFLQVYCDIKYARLEDLFSSSKRLFDKIFSSKGIEIFGYIAQHRSRRFSRFDLSDKRLKSKMFLRIKDAKSIVYPLGWHRSDTGGGILKQPKATNKKYNDETFCLNNWLEGLINSEKIQQYPAFGVSLVRLLTGRTHQIRAQFRYLGMPVVGDRIYSATKLPEKQYILTHEIKNDILRPVKLGLVALGLSFYDLDGKRLYFALPFRFLR